ncbi:MAG: class I SAM-dependent methyltransferase [Bacteroidales bacterium]|nr:class I SAM-dependent methyltransferase [Bacteroidales bacterium]
MKEVNQCPVCKNTGFVSVMEVKDHFLSGETFSIMRCENCQHRFTNPIPEPDELPGYYQSEEYISHSSSNKGLVNQAYKLVRKYTVKRKYNLINHHKKGHRILDIGSGTGEFLHEFSKNGWEASGIEPNNEARQTAINEYNLDIRDEHELNDLPSGYYDVISMWHVLEHVPNLQERASEISRLIKDEGLLVIALPNFYANDAQKYGAFWAAWDVPRHLHHFTKSSLITLFEPFGFKIKKKKPMKFDAFYVSLLSEKYQSGKVNYVSALKNGVVSNRKARKEMNYSSLVYLLYKK